MMLKTKVLFVTLTRHDEPLGIMYLSKILKNYGYQVRGVMLERQNIFEVIDEFRPTIIGYSAMSCEISKILSLNSKLKKKYEFFSIVGGPLATFSTDIIDNKDIDAVCIGEGEEAMLELVNRIDKRDDIRNIENIWVKIDGRLYKNDIRPLIKNLDSIPFPDREIFKNYKLDKAYNVNTSRGCPFECTYCHNKNYKALYKQKGSAIRYRTVDNLIEELIQIKEKFNPSIFLFQDDHSYHNLDIVKEFAYKYKTIIDKPFTFALRPEFITEELAKTLKEANCKYVFTGCEAGNDRVRKTILKRNISKRQIIRSCDLLNKYQINSCLQNMIGIPTSNFEDDIETLELNIRCKPYYAWVSICTPYPGTEIFTIAKRAGLIKKNYLNQLYETYHFKTSLKIIHEDKVNILHKIFALVVEYPNLLTLIKRASFYSNIDKNRIKELKNIFESFKKYKFEKLCNDGIKIPNIVSDFINGLLKQI